MGAFGAEGCGVELDPVAGLAAAGAPEAGAELVVAVPELVASVPFEVAEPDWESLPVVAELSPGRSSISLCGLGAGLVVSAGGSCLAG